MDVWFNEYVLLERRHAVWVLLMQKYGRGVKSSELSHHHQAMIEVQRLLSL
jgi:hypothetical protein